MRSVGYSFNAAVADIIDNSIAANSSRIDMFVDTVQGEYVCFLDNGTGMSADEAREALKLAGTRHVERGESDLGRFGLGLKTASLSQGRRLTVLSQQSDMTTGLQWDLDHVLNSGKWSIRVLDELDMTDVPHARTLFDSDHGTLVLWQSLDYLLSGATDIAQWMNSLVADLRAHLGLVFHRFLEGANAIEIFVNGVKIVPTDPFLEKNRKTQIAPVENVVIHGETVKVEAFTLPHISGLTAAERKREDLGAKMRERQGFYVYRNRRLISAGGWFGLAKQDELSKQTRVRVDIPPALDKHWQLDIKKSRVEPPQAFRQRFRQIVEHVKVPSTRVHRFRGRKAPLSELSYFWRLVEDRDGFRYEINPEHPAVVSARESSAPERRIAFDELLHDLASTFPANDLYLRLADNKRLTPTEYADAFVARRLRELRSAGAADADPDQLAELLSRQEPFSEIADLRSLVHNIWKEDL